MPRTARAVEAGGYYHVLNRGNGRMDLFHKPADFDAFARILAEGLERYRVELLAWCLMSNHWHLVLRPGRGEELGRLMGWVCVTHVRRHHAHYHSAGGGHLYQDRFKSFPVQDDRHFLVLCRYVEANPVRAGLVSSGRDWPWGNSNGTSLLFGAAMPAAPNDLSATEVSSNEIDLSWTDNSGAPPTPPGLRPLRPLEFQPSRAAPRQSPPRLATSSVQPNATTDQPEAKAAVCANRRRIRDRSVNENPR